MPNKVESNKKKKILWEDGDLGSKFIDAKDCPHEFDKEHELDDWSCIYCGKLAPIKKD